MNQDKPQRCPIMRAVTHEEVGDAIGRLVEIARADTGQSARVADFLLAWWNGEDNGHFPILHLCNCDPVIGEDMVAIMAYFAQELTVYADAWGYQDTMAELAERWRTRAS